MNKKNINIHVLLLLTIISINIILFFILLIPKENSKSINNINETNLLNKCELEINTGGASQCQWIGVCTQADTVCFAEGDSIVVGKRKCRLPGNVVCCSRTIFVEGCAGAKISTMNWTGNPTGCPF